MGLIGDIFKGISSKNAASAASGAEQGGAKAAQALELQNQQAAQAAQGTATSTNTTNQAPYTALGATSAAGLQALLQKGFTAPTLSEAEATPGYQFNLESGTNALEKGAAARGNVLSGTEGTALQQYGQQLGTTTYQQAYQNALNSHMANLQGLTTGTNIGQGAVSQEGQVGQAGAQNLANIDMTGGVEQANQINNAANARATGYQQKATALNGMVSDIGNTFASALNPASLVYGGHA